VIAFEPNPAAREVLERHVAYNQFSHRVRIEPMAVGGTCGQAAFYAADADGMSRLGCPNPLVEGRSKACTVEVTTLDAYCRATACRPDWLFIDIEGFEIDALSGARDLFRAPTGPEVIVEMHPDLWESAGTDRRRAERLLEELGRRAVPLAGQSDVLGEYGLVRLVPA
jgi:FkbM family methyltransferase